MSTAMVEVVGVHKSYGRRPVLQDVHLRVAAGEVAVLLGPSGSGKSTLLRCINHLVKVDRGVVRVDGELIGCRQVGDRLRELSERKLLRQRSRIGFVFQDLHLFPHLTAAQNVTVAPVATHRWSRRSAYARATSLLDRVGMADRADDYPARLSGGQQQRVAIARALASQPKVMLCDEPTSSLDPELVAEVLEVMKDLARDGTTMVVVTHELGFARDVADTVTFLDDGRIVESGPADQVLDHPRTERARTFLRGTDRPPTRL